MKTWQERIEENLKWLREEEVSIITKSKKNGKKIYGSF